MIESSDEIIFKTSSCLESDKVSTSSLGPQRNTSSRIEAHLPSPLCVVAQAWPVEASIIETATESAATERAQRRAEESVPISDSS